MADVKTDKEPSIEEILESIRQIISDDGEAPAKPAEAQVITAPVEPPPPAPQVDLSAKAEPAPAPATDNVLVLTDKVDIPKSDLDLSVTEPAMTDTGGELLSNVTADAATAAMAKLLAGNVAVEREETGRTGSVTLEDMARELMRPLVKSWLDQNLPGIIEKMVQKEIEKISRRAGG